MLHKETFSQNRFYLPFPKRWEAFACDWAGSLDHSDDYWGCVELLCNPDRIPGDIQKAWADRVGNEPDYGRVTQTQAEGRLIDKNGLLLIHWPTLVDRGEPVRLDLLLVTANDPEISATNPSYPTVDTG